MTGWEVYTAVNCKEICIFNVINLWPNFFLLINKLFVSLKFKHFYKNTPGKKIHYTISLVDAFAILTEQILKKNGGNCNNI